MQVLIKWLFVSILSGVILFFSSCSQKQLKTDTAPKIDLKNPVKIAIMPWLNRTYLNQARNWPADKLKDDKLWENFEEINSEFLNQIGRHSRLNRITVVHQSEFPDYRLQLVFLTPIREEGEWKFPFEVHGYDQGPQRINIKALFYARTSLGNREIPKEGFYYWGAVMQNIKRNFPFSEVLNGILGPEF